MKTYKYMFIILALLQFAASSCKDDELFRSNGRGETVIVHDLTFTASQVVKVDVPLTRADSHSEIQSVTLFFFDEAGGIEYIGDFTSESLEEINSDNIRNRTYQLNASIKITTGTKHCYAIANAMSDYWVNCLETLKGLTREESFKQYLFSINTQLITRQTLPTLTSPILWLSGYGEVQISGSGSNGSASGTVYLKRPIAQINFNVNNTYKDNNDNVHTFIPETYAVYNVPQQMPVIEMGSLMGTGNDTRAYYNTISYNFDAAGNDGISREAFYMPENDQQNSDNLTSYHDRDAWNNEYIDEAKTEKKWANAPQKSTYIIISGQYTQRDKDNLLIRQGNVNYTIHLGDFSEDKWENFTIERNCRYTYTLTVRGVDKIVVEATVERKEEQPGAEGDIIENTSASESFDLDCHFEQVYVEYDLTAIANEIEEQMQKESALERELDTYIGNSFILKASTPFSNADFVVPYSRALAGEGEGNVTDGMDYKWIYFLSQNEERQIAKYPGDNCKDQTASSIVYDKAEKELINPYELCVRLGKLVKQIITNTDGNISNNYDIIISEDDENQHKIARFTAFIDENYYQRDPTNSSIIVGWDSYTRQNDRSMLIASDIHISTDGFSTYAIARTSFTQRSVQTFYNASAVDNTNALGMETYCENGLRPMQAPTSGTYNANAGTSPSDGRLNMIGLTQCENKSWDTYIKSSTNGYLSADKSRDHRIDEYSLVNGTLSYYASNMLQETYLHPYFACLSRNRDLNGNGTIDDNEIRWYLPSGDQYLRLSIGSDAMSEASRLFEGDKTTIEKYSDYPSKFLDNGALYMTSTLVDPVSGTNKRVLWAGEVGAFGGFNSNYGFVRCVRNLPKKSIVDSNPDQVEVGDNALGTVSYTLKQTSDGNYLFDFENRLDTRIYRVDAQEGAYESHFEEPIATNMSEANRLPQGFVVARYDVGFSSSFGEPTSFGEYKENIWSGQGENRRPCDNYTEGGGAYNGKWRVPNLREMMVMSSQAQQLGFFNYNVGLYYYIISTDFSGRDDNNERQGFAFQAKNWNNNGNLVNTGFITVETSSNNIYVRCVRDMTDADK